MTLICKRKKSESFMPCLQRLALQKACLAQRLALHKGPKHSILECCDLREKGECIWLHGEAYSTHAMHQKMEGTPYINQ